MGVRQIDGFLEQWQMDAKDLHRRLILAPAPKAASPRQAGRKRSHLLIATPRVLP